MKRILLIMVLLMFVLGTSCLAAEPSQSERDARSLLADLKDLGYSFDAGINYKEFRESYRKAYSSTNRYRDIYRNLDENKEIIVKAEKLMNVYRAVDEIWGYKINSRSTDLPKIEWIWEEFPRLQNLKRNFWGNYDSQDSILRTVLSNNHPREKELEDVINNRYNPPIK